jgi:Prealbumin-like fold domain
MDGKGPGSRRGLRGRRWVVAVVATAVAAAMAIFIPAAFGVLSGSPSSFEAQDGDMVAGNHGGTNDWNSVTGNANYVHLSDLASTTGDDSFKSGQKQDSVCPVINTNKNPPKDDFTDVASFNEVNLNSASSQFRHVFLYGATIRFTANGNASENVELNQGKNGTCGTDPVTGVALLARSVGDKLLAIDYLNGGTNVNFHVLTWIDGTDSTNATCFVGNDNPPCWGAVVQTLSSNAAEGLVNQSAIAAADNGINGQALVVGQFAEFGVDLTAAGIIPANTCTAIPQTVWESRSSGSSFVSSTEDVALEHHTISTCGEIKIIKHTDPRGLNQVFNYTSNLLANSQAGGVACSAGGSAGVASNGNFCLNDSGNTTADNGANTVDENNLQSGSYTVAESSTNPTGFAFQSVSCKVNGVTTNLVDAQNARQVNITLQPNDVVVCTYVNKQQLGAIKITKVSSKAAATALSGAHFRVCTNGTDGGAFVSCTAAKTGSDDLGPTGSDGTVCVDNLPFGDYYVSEKSAPNGYAVDDATVHKVTVSHNATCTPPSGQTYGGESIQFSDTPLTDLTVHVASEATGGTKSAVTCTNNAGGAAIGNSPQPTGAVPGTTSTYGDPVTLTADPTHGAALKPGTYTCTISIDP